MSPLEIIKDLQARMGESIIGQEDVIERLLIGLLANGNSLMEGLPGLAKTRAVKALAKNLEADFSRIQFTPDLLLLMSPARKSTTRKTAPESSASSPDPSSPTSCSAMRSTGHRPKCRRLCSRPWKSVR